MMDWQNLLGTAATVIALASAAGLGLMRGSLSNLRAENTDLTRRVDFLEKADARNEAEKAELRAEVISLTHDAEVLRSAIQGRADYTALSDQVEDVARTINRIDKTLTEAFKELP